MFQWRFIVCLWSDGETCGVLTANEVSEVKKLLEKQQQQQQRVSVIEEKTHNAHHQASVSTPSSFSAQHICTRLIVVILTSTRCPGAQGSPLPRRPVSWSTTQRPVEPSSGPTMREMDWPGPEGQWNPPQRICGGVRRVVVTEEQRYGPRWLCDNDDDDIDQYHIHINCTAFNVVSHCLGLVFTGSY